MLRLTTEAYGDLVDENIVMYLSIEHLNIEH